MKKRVFYPCNHPQVEQALTSTARALLNNRQNTLTTEHTEWLQRYFAQHGAKIFLNHKILMPKHVKPIVRYLHTPTSFTLTQPERTTLETLLAALGPSP